MTYQTDNSKPGPALTPHEIARGWAWLSVNGNIVACLWDVGLLGDGKVRGTLHVRPPQPGELKGGE